MGVKAVWGALREPVLCFGSRDKLGNKSESHYSTAHSAAKKAVDRPYLVTIGGGKLVRDGLKGCVVEVLRVTGVYGETSAFVRDPGAAERLKQWPVAVVISEAYSVVGEPSLMQDLDFPDRRLLQQAHDSVKTNTEDLQKLWQALAARQIIFRRDIAPPPGFRDPGTVLRCGSLYPTLTVSAPEGMAVYKTMKVVERNASLVRSAKDANRLRYGKLTCEACNLADDNGSLFDAHHLRPLSRAGLGETPVEHLAVLCPTCHRWAHVKADDPLEPIPIEDIRAARALEV